MKNSKKLFSVIALGVGLSFSSSAVFANEVAPISAISLPQQTPSLAPMLEQVLPAVVTVHTEGKEVRKQQIPDEFRFFFGDMLPNNNSTVRPFQGLGSGVIVDAQNGYIVTNNHVINKADTIKIKLNDGREFDAKLLGRDAQSDIALLQIKDPKNLVSVKIANSDSLRVGDFAVAIGNPFGLGQTATSGIISALGRSGLNVSGLENFIQTDASINRGNSGGALINLNGELIGINTAIIAPGGGNVGIGFAIPSNMVKDLVGQLVEFGEVKRGMLGIKGLELTADIAKEFNLNVQQGAFVSEVLPKSAAEKGGLKSGDVIISIDDKTINSFAELRAKIATMGAGKKVALGIIRNGQSITQHIELQNNEADATQANAIMPQLDGASLSNNTVNNNPAVKIDTITKGSAAERLGLQAGDFIIGVNKQSITNIADLRKVIDKKPTVIILNIIRGNSNIYLILR